MKQQKNRSQLIEELAEVRSQNADLQKALTKTKRLLKESQTSENRWRKLIKGFPERILIVDKKGTVIFLNRTGPGRTIKEVLGTNIMDYLPVEEQIRIKDVLGKVFKTGMSLSYRGYFTNKDGSESWYESQAIPLNNKGKTEQVLFLVTDITESMKADIALQESEQKFRTLAEESPNMIFINKKGRIVYVNPRCEELLGYSKSEFLAYDFDFRCLISPEFHDSIADNMTKHLRGEDVPSEEYALLTKTGKRIEDILTTRLIRYENESAILGIVTDITHRKKAEKELKADFDILEQKVNERTVELSDSNLKLMFEIEERKRIEKALRSSEEKLRSILESSPDAITMTDENAVIVECNQATLDLHGISKKEDLIGTASYDLIAPRDRKRAVENLRRTIKYGVVMNVEYSFLKKDGNEVPAELSASVIKDSGGRLVGFVAVIKDISVRKKAENALIASKALLKVRTEELEEKNIALREIIAQIEMEKRRMREDIMTNVSAVVSPILENLSHFPESKIYVGLLKHHLDRLTSSFGARITDKDVGLTPREIELCNMIKGGLSSKEISQLLNISLTTVERHRKNIRKKLNITNKNVNLAGYLQRLQ